MEQESRSRRCRRSIRNLRRSSGFFGDPYIADLEVEIPETVIFGSVWLKEGNQKQSPGQLVTCNVEAATHCAEVDSFVTTHCSDGQVVLPSLDIHSELANEGSFNVTEFHSHQPLVHEECMTQLASKIASSDNRDVPSFSVHDAKMDNVTWLQSYKQHKMHSGMRLHCGGEPQTAADSLPACISNNTVHESINREKDVSSMKEMFRQPQTDTGPVSAFISGIMLHDNVSNASILTENTSQISTEVLKHFESSLDCERKTVNTCHKTVSANEEERDILAGKISISDHNSKAGSVYVASSRKDRRKSERYMGKVDTVSWPDTEPKKRKRLSLNKIKVNTLSAETKSDGTENVEKNTEFKQSAGVEMVANKKEKDSNVDSVTYSYNTCSSQMTDARWLTENQENIDCVDLPTTREIFRGIDINDYCFPDFRMTSKKKGKKNSQSKAKANRRSSRYFNLHEMPLGGFSCEQIPEVGSAMSSVSKATSPKFSASCGEVENSGENKENSPVVRLNTPTKTYRLEDYSAASLDTTTISENSSLKGVVFMEEVLEGIADLCVNEKSDTDCSNDISLLQQTRKKSEHRRRSNTIIYTTAANISHSGEDKECLSDIKPQNDNPDMCISSQGSFLEHVSNDGAVDSHTGKSAEDCGSENFCKLNIDDMEVGQSCREITSSASETGMDMDDLPSLGNMSAESETQPSVSSGSTRFMRIRRSRKSWDMNKTLASNREKKPQRRVGRRGNTEKQPAETLLSDSAQFSSSLDDATVTCQSSDDRAPSEMYEPRSSEDDTNDVISPGLISLYQNKNFVRPQPRPWETIKESPKSSQSLFSKQRHKCFLEFENGITRARLQRRHKKAIDVYKKLEVQPAAITYDEFDRKMLDIQLFIDS